MESMVNFTQLSRVSRLAQEQLFARKTRVYTFQFPESTVFG